MASSGRRRNRDNQVHPAFLGDHLAPSNEEYQQNERLERRAEWIRGECRLLELVAASLLDTILERRTKFRTNVEFLKAMRTVAATGVQQLQSIVRKTADELQIRREEDEPEEAYDEHVETDRRNLAQEIEWMWQDTWQENEPEPNPEGLPERERLFTPARQELECLIKVAKLVLRRHQADVVERPPQYHSPAVRRDPVTGELPPNYHSRSTTPVQFVERDMTRALVRDMARAFRDAGERGEERRFRPLSLIFAQEIPRSPSGTRDTPTSPSSPRAVTTSPSTPRDNSNTQEPQTPRRQRRRSDWGNILQRLLGRYASPGEGESDPSSSRPQSSSTARPTTQQSPTSPTLPRSPQPRHEQRSIPQTPPRNDNLHSTESYDVLLPRVVPSSSSSSSPSRQQRLSHNSPTIVRDMVHSGQVWTEDEFQRSFPGGSPSASNVPPAGQSRSSGRGAGRSRQPPAGPSGQHRSGRDRRDGRR